MATTTPGDAKLADLTSHVNHDDEELWDQNIEALLSAGDVAGARAEFERQCVASLDSGDPILMTPEKWEELRTELSRYATDKDQEREGSDEFTCGISDEPRPGRPGYTVDTLLDRGNTVEAKIELGRLLLQGMTSVTPVEATPQFFENAREKLRCKSEQLKAKKSA